MSASPVINRNERTASVIKVVSLYVLVGLLLAFLLLWNRGLPNGAYEELLTEKQRLTEGSENLGRAIATLDTIAKLTEVTFLLQNGGYGQMSAGGRKLKENVTLNDLNKFGAEFAMMKDSLTEENTKSTRGIFESVTNLRSKLDSLVERIEGIQAVCETKIGMDSLNQAMTDLESLQEVSTLRKENADLTQEIAALTKALTSAGTSPGGSGSAETAALKGELSKVLGDLKEVDAELEGGIKLTGVLAERYKNVINLAHSKLGNAISKLEGLL